MVRISHDDDRLKLYFRELATIQPLGLFAALRSSVESRGTFTDHAATCSKDAITKLVTEITMKSGQPPGFRSRVSGSPYW